MTDYINILYGKNKFLVQKKLTEKIALTEVDEINISRYDINHATSDDILEDLRTVSFFSERKVIIISNMQELLKESDAVLSQWVKYFENPNPDVYLFIILEELINEKHILGSTLFKKSYIEEVGEMTKDQYPQYVIDYLKKLNFHIDEKAVKELLVRTDYDLDLITQELEKLMLYKFDDPNIDLESIFLLVSRNLEENIYELTNNFLNKNNNKTIEIYYDLLARSEDPIRIMNSIINKIRELIHTKLLLERGYSQEDVAKHFNIKNGIAYYLIKNANQTSLEVLEAHLKRLSKLDYEIKTGKIDKKLGLEIFILGAWLWKMLKKY